MDREMYLCSSTQHGRISKKEIFEERGFEASSEALHWKQRRKEGGKGRHLPECRITVGSRITAGGAEKSHQCRKYFLQQHICFRKTFRLEHSAAKVDYCPGRYLTSFAPDWKRFARSDPIMNFVKSS